MIPQYNNYKNTRISQKEIKKHFTNDLVRLLASRGGKATYWRDTEEPSLVLCVSPYEKRSLYYKRRGYIKLIGDIHEVTVEKAREITKNIDQNFEEVMNTEFQDRIPLCREYAKNGAFPRKQKVVEARIDKEAIVHEINQAMTLLENAKKKLLSEYDLRLF